MSIKRPLTAHGPIHGNSPAACQWAADLCQDRRPGRPSPAASDEPLRLEVPDRCIRAPAAGEPKIRPGVHCFSTSYRPQYLSHNRDPGRPVRVRRQEGALYKRTWIAPLWLLSTETSEPIREERPKGGSRRGNALPLSSWQLIDRPSRCLRVTGRLLY